MKAIAAQIEVGDFIGIPAWKTFGQVIAVDNAKIGPESQRQVILQERPDQPAATCRRYTLDDGGFELEREGL